MIIFGTRGVTYKKESGDFHCPGCSDKTAYKHKRVRRFFTLYFIPLVPLDLLGEFVECEKCKDTYKLEILEFDPETQQQEWRAAYHDAVLQVMIAMMLADSAIEQSEIDTVRTIYHRITEREISEQEVRQQIDLMRTASTDLLETVQRIGMSLNESGKEQVIQAAFLVGFADGVFDDFEKKVLVDVANALNMTEAHFQGVLGQLTVDEQRAA